MPLEIFCLLSTRSRFNWPEIDISVRKESVLSSEGFIGKEKSQRKGVAYRTGES